MTAEAVVVGQVPSLNAISGGVGEVGFGLILYKIVIKVTVMYQGVTA